MTHTHRFLCGCMKAFVIIVPFKFLPYVVEGLKELPRNEESAPCNFSIKISVGFGGVFSETRAHWDKNVLRSLKFFL